MLLSLLQFLQPVGQTVKPAKTAGDRGLTLLETAKRSRKPLCCLVSPCLLMAGFLCGQSKAMLSFISVDISSH